MNILKEIMIIISVLLFTGCGSIETKRDGNIKIFALSPSITETIFFLGGGKDIEGVSSYCNYPEDAKNIPSIASSDDINLEYCLKIDPDIAFILPSQENIKEKFGKLGIKTVTVDQRTLKDILNSFSVIGEHINRKERAKVLKDSLELVIRSLKSEEKNMDILISVGREYGTDATYIYSSGKSGFLNDIIELLGYSNALDTSIPYPKIGAEAIMTIDPHIILDLVSSEVPVTKKELLTDWKLYDNGSAWQNGNIIVIKGDHTTIPGPRIFDFINELKERGL